MTGLTVDYIKEANLRVSPTRFRKEVMRSDRKTLGRYDMRFEGVDHASIGLAKVREKRRVLHALESSRNVLFEEAHDPGQLFQSNLGVDARRIAQVDARDLR